MPITATPIGAGSYATLNAGAGHLKNLGPLAETASVGITQDDLDAAEAHARSMIDASLADVYDTSDWLSATPPIIGKIARLLASADVLDYKHARVDPATSSAYAASLRTEARLLLRQVRGGRLSVVGADGTVVTRLVAAPNLGRS